MIQNDNPELFTQEEDEVSEMVEQHKRLKVRPPVRWRSTAGRIMTAILGKELKPEVKSIKPFWL